MALRPKIGKKPAEPRIEVVGYYGLNSRPFRREFVNQAAYASWYTANVENGNYVVTGSRDIEG